MASACHRRVGRSQAPGDENAGDQRDVEQELERGGELDQRQVPARIFEHHGFMHHGELKMRGGIVDGDAGVLGNRHHDQGDEREPE